MKTKLNYFKRIVILIFAVGTLSSAEECDWFSTDSDSIEEKEKKECDECIAAQKHYFNALQNNRCNTTVTAGARTKVINACPAGKAAYIVEKCQLGEVPSYSCK